MNKRAFLKLLSTLMATPVLYPMLAWALGDKLKNYSSLQHSRLRPSITKARAHLWLASAIDAL